MTKPVADRRASAPRAPVNLWGLLVGLALASALVLACSSTADDAHRVNDAISSTAEAISNGDEVSNPGSIVHLGFTTTGEPSMCTGVLITPMHVLTAAHCFKGAFNWPFATSNWGIFPEEGPVRIQTDEVPFDNVTPSPGDAMSFHGEPDHAIRLFDLSVPPMNFNEPNISERDLAIVPLDRRVASNVATPATLPFDAAGNLTPCSQSFTGTYFGYGSGGLWAAQSGLLRRGQRGVARGQSTAIFGDVYRGTFSLGSQFFDGIPAFGDVVNEILAAGENQTLQGGDSGGPMFQAGASGTLCGINSGLFLGELECTVHSVPNPIPGLPDIPIGFICDLTIANHHSRVDRPLAAEWIRSQVVDEQGRFFGTCDQGPQALRDTDTDDDGIPDPCDPCPRVEDLGYRDSGLSAHLPNPATCGATDVGETGDVDCDGVPNLCDNCPADANPYDFSSEQVSAPFLFTPFQPDGDGDAMGDACDDCPFSNLRGESEGQCCNSHADCGNPFGSLYHSRCVPEQTGMCAGFAGRCSRGLDADLDSVMDHCDNCRDSYNPGQSDTDADSIGDACDNCAGLKAAQPEDRNDIPSMECESDADCFANTGNPNSRCMPPELTLSNLSELVRYCDKFADPDQDALGAPCDNCALTHNPGQANCNLDNELVESVPYPYVGDACDANPCTRFTGQSTHQSSTGGDLWVLLSENPQILPPSAIARYPIGQVPFDRTITDTPLATVGGRFCPCDLNAGPWQVSTPMQCHLAGQCTIDANDYVELPPDTNWQHPSLIEQPVPLSALPSDPLPSDFVSEFSGLPLEEPQLGLKAAGDPLAPFGLAPFHLAWDVTADGAGFHPEFGPISHGLLGIYWAPVRNVPQMQPASVGEFLRFSNNYVQGFFGRPDDSLKYAGQALISCLWCGVEPCQHCGITRDTKTLIINPELLQIVIASSSGAVDRTSAFTTAAIDKLMQPDLLWVQVAESEHFLRSGQPGLASVSADGSQIGDALAYRNGIVQTTLGSTFPVPSLQSAQNAPLEPPAPAPRSGFGVVLSQREQAVFVIGGELLATGQLARDVWQFDLASQRWLPLALGGSPSPMRVLSATYRPEDRSLYVLDERQAGPKQQARLLRLELETLDISVLGAWPRSGQIDRVDLAPAPSGHLLITGSSKKHHRVVGVVLERDGHKLRVVADFEHPGVLALAPTLVESGLTLPLVDPSAPAGVSNAFVPYAAIYAPKPKPEKGKPDHTRIGEVL